MTKFQIAERIDAMQAGLDEGEGAVVEELRRVVLRLIGEGMAEGGVGLRGALREVLAAREARGAADVGGVLSVAGDPDIPAEWSRPDHGTPSESH